MIDPKGTLLAISTLAETWAPKTEGDIQHAFAVMQRVAAETVAEAGDMIGMLEVIGLLAAAWASRTDGAIQQAFETIQQDACAAVKANAPEDGRSLRNEKKSSQHSRTRNKPQSRRAKGHE